MDWTKTFVKGLIALGLGIVGILVGAVADALGNGGAIADAVNAAGLPGFVALALVPALAAVGEMLRNWWKHRDDPA